MALSGQHPSCFCFKLFPTVFSFAHFSQPTVIPNSWQGISKAGNQMGMDDDRSNLMLEMWRLWDEGEEVDMLVTLGAICFA